MAHRGPDDSGTYIDADNSVYFAHRRLSILDVTDAGHQPMASNDGSVVVVYNGEIYNFLELREDLARKGRIFQTSSDTEVLIQAYAEWGMDCLSRFNGMFAFALWDRSRKKLFLARDRIGVKPLYLLEGPHGLMFASEVKTFKALPEVSFTADEELVPVFLRDGYVTGERTFFRKVRKLMPGHFMEVSDGGVAVRKYWELSYKTEDGIVEAEWEERLSALLIESVNLRLRSDVPVGVLLSGGLDSTTIVALLEGKSDIPTKTFSVAYQLGEDFDETPYARLAARRYRTEHHEYYVTPKEFRDFIPQYVWHMDEPVSEAAGISLYYISRLAREHVTVVLSGEGSDELFAGYDIYRYMLWIETLRNAVGPFLRGRGRIAKFLGHRGERIRKYMNLAALPMEERYRGVNLLSQIELEGVCQNAVEGRMGSPEEYWHQTFSSGRGWAPLNRLLYADTKTWLVDDILIKADKMTMANSLELRVPFLDYRVVELAASMNPSLKLRHGEKKYILKRIMRKKVPEKILRRPKMGFPTPIALLFRGPLNGYLREILLDSRTQSRGYFDRRGVEGAINLHEQGVDRSQLIWRMLVLEEWHRVFVDGGTY